jgi:hypothetical protein
MVSFSALRAGHPLPLVLISFRDRVYRRAILPLEGLDQFKDPVTSSGMEPTTLRLARRNNIYDA